MAKTKLELTWIGKESRPKLEPWVLLEDHEKSYPGPDASIRIETLNSDKIFARRYRNRRIGEFLKELDLTEGRCTGIPIMRAAMENNGSPPPRFSTDEGRTYFVAELPVHPEMKGGLAQVKAQVGTKLGPSRDQVEVLRNCLTDKSLVELMAAAGRSNRSKFRSQVLRPLLDAGLVEMTVPTAPNSPVQMYRLTPDGRAALEDSKSEP